MSIYALTWGNPASEPLVIYSLLNLSQDLNDKDSDRGLLESVTKVEVDFCDNGGWEDATPWFNDYFTPPYDNTTAGKIKHTYPAAGVYAMQIRATFWDGEVVYWNSQLDPHKQITVPYSAAEHDGQPWSEP